MATQRLWKGNVFAILKINKWKEAIFIPLSLKVQTCQDKSKISAEERNQALLRAEISPSVSRLLFTCILMMTQKRHML